MKIKSVYISAFGRLEDVTFDFKDDFNLIYGENEKGKSTLMTFIRLMFYGTAGRSGDVARNPRKRYIPWSGKPAAGSITFETGGEEYKLERTFGASVSTDKIALTKLSSGERKTFSGSTDLGAAFFKMSSDAFEKCAFMSAPDVKSSGPDGIAEINTKLANLSSSGDEDVSLGQALKRLDEAKTRLVKKRGGGGILPEEKEKLRRLGEELTVAFETEERRLSLAKKTSRDKAEEKELSEKTEKIKAFLENEESQKLAERLADYIKADALLKSADARLTAKSGKLLDTAFVSECEEKIRKIKELQNDAAAFEGETNSLTVAVEELTKAIEMKSAGEVSAIEEKMAEYRVKRDAAEKRLAGLTEEKDGVDAELEPVKPVRKKPSAVFLITALISLAAALVFTVLKILPGIIAAGATALVFAVLSFATAKDVNEEKRERLEDRKTEILGEMSDVYTDIDAVRDSEDVLKQRLSEIKQSVSGTETLLSSKKSDLEIKTAALEKCREQIAALSENVLKVISDYKEVKRISEAEIVLFSVKELIEKQKNAEAKFQYLKDDLDSISVGEANAKLSELESVPASDGEYTKTDLANTEARLSELRSAIALDEAKARTDFRFAKHPTVLEHEIAGSKERVSKLESHYEALSLAEAVLQDAANTARKNFGVALEKRTTEIFSEITGGKYKYMGISRDFDISVEETDVFGSHELGYLSSGTADQAYFALRLAVSEFLSKDGEPLPLFLDDVFANYDDARAEAAFRFIKEYAENNQVFFFTCHKSFSDFG